MRRCFWKRDGKIELISGLILVLLAIIMLWLGTALSDIPLRAFARPVARQNLEAQGVSEEYLQASVDSLAIALGGALQVVNESYDRKAVVSSALDSVSFSNGKSIHYMAWEGPVVIHAPLAPDVNAMDFSSAKDAYGNNFMQDVICQAATGGFLTLHFSDQGAHSEKQTVYSRVIPGSSWFLAAFAPENRAQTEHGRPNALRFGLVLMGISLAGLSLLVLERGVLLHRIYRVKLSGVS